MADAYKVREHGTLIWAQGICASLLLLSFFLPWVHWESLSVSGYDLPFGSFFTASESVHGPADPFPQFRFGMYIFWLVPAMAVLLLLFSLFKKKVVPVSFVAAALALAMVTVFILFTKTLIDFGVGNSLMAMMQPGLYLQVAAAVGLVLSALPVKHVAIKFACLLAGPVLAFAAYSVGEHYIMNETYIATEKVSVDYTVNATDLLKEFLNNDTLTNKKYLDKTLLVNGIASEVNVLADSSSSIQFKDNNGSYIIYSLEKNELEQVKKLKAGTAVSIKGVCSGSIFSEILGTTSVTFKRATLK
jgi:hypothetical protein